MLMDGPTLENGQKFPTQQSVSIALIEGETYYIEALHKEDTGGDHLSVRWQLPSSVIEEPIAGTRLSPYECSIDGSNDHFPHDYG